MSDITNSASNRSTNHRAVTFSETSHLVYIHKDDDESKWYSSQERRVYQRELAIDIARMSREINDAPAGSISKDQLYKCVGIEMFLTQGLANRVTNVKQEHMDAVLAEQRLQNQRCICDADKLCKVSKKTSRWSRKRAQALAFGYSEI